MTVTAYRMMVSERRRRLTLSLYFLIALVVFSCNAAAAEKPIYGTDDRNEILFSDTVACRAALSTVAILSSDMLQKNAQNQWKLLARDTLGSKGWCADERFSDQLSVVSCSGFLISSDRVVTAAHCINAQDDPHGPGLNCESALLVFDYQIADDGELPLSYRSDQVRACQLVLDGEEVSGGADWRVVQLDQPVDRNPLAVLNSQAVGGVAELMTVIGHPLGLPMKSARNGTIRSDTLDRHFTLNIDSYEGNSGSGVIASVRGVPVVIGMLTSGSKDYVLSDHSCKRSKICEAEECRGETATRASVFSAWAGTTVTAQTIASLPQLVSPDSCS